MSRVEFTVVPTDSALQICHQFSVDLSYGYIPRGELRKRSEPVPTTFTGCTTQGSSTMEWRT
ncbi:hypothetical protein ACPCG0_09090 [Propionibacteriaceae bacterium Y1923]|uniref:hypothetical protein n=1 Tax=Aestuariimicrobium sp. Y1814 TaxID=3418742 RepID=UPI003C13DF56